MDYIAEVEEAVNGSSYYKHFIRTFKVKMAKEVSVEDASAILMGKCELSQRRYISLRSVLADSNVTLP